MLMMRFLTRKFNEDAAARLWAIEFCRNENKYLYSILLLIKSLTRARGR